MPTRCPLHSTQGGGKVGDVPEDRRPADASRDGNMLPSQGVGWAVHGRAAAKAKAQLGRRGSADHGRSLR